jgi:hypothetical protein
VKALLERRLAGLLPRLLRSGCCVVTGPPLAGDSPAADALSAWMGGQPQVASPAKRLAGVRGDLDHFGAIALLQGLSRCVGTSVTPTRCWFRGGGNLQPVVGDVRDKVRKALRSASRGSNPADPPAVPSHHRDAPRSLEGPSGCYASWST